MPRLEVRLTWGTDEVPVGVLVQRGRQIFFEYASEFLAEPLPISPFHLPAVSGPLEDTEQTFGGLFGVFNDSLPDGWGLLLMDRHFRQQGLTQAITPLDRLAYIHTRGMGALTYHPPSDAPEESFASLDLAVLAQQAERIVEGSAEEVLPELRLAGGSPGGARPKVLVGVNPETGHLVAGTDIIPAEYRHYLIKFGTQEDGPFIVVIEAAYALMAAEAGIDFPKNRLFGTDDGRQYFGVERFDRQGNQRFHVHTLGGLLHASHRIPSLGYEGYLRATLALTRDQRQVEEAYRRMAFNVFAYNRDDHVKNFSYRMLPNGQWQLAPAYDLVFSIGINGWHTMDVAGEAQNPTSADMLRLASAAGLASSSARDIIEQVRTAVSRWSEFAATTGVPKEDTRRIRDALNRMR